MMVSVNSIPEKRMLWQGLQLFPRSMQWTIILAFHPTIATSVYKATLHTTKNIPQSEEVYNSLSVSVVAKYKTKQGRSVL